MDVPDVCAHWLAALSQTLRGSVLLVAWETQTRLMKSQRCTDLPSTPWKILPLLRPPLSWAGVYLCWCPPMCIHYTVCLSFIPYMHFMFCRSCGLSSHLNAVIGRNQLHLLKYYKMADIILRITMWQCERGLVFVINLNRKLKMIFWGKVLPLFDIPITVEEAGHRKREG